MILVGEMRDLETIRLALTGAETGHLVFGTLHTSSAAKTIDRIVDVFPAAEKEMVRAMLSESLRAVISQTLLKRIGGGRIAAHEIMIGTPAIRNLIREGKIAQMYSAIQTGQAAGMQTLDQCLKELLQKGLITKEEARFRPRTRRISRRGADGHGPPGSTMERDTGIKLMQDLLRRMVERKGSDLFITSGFPPAIKVDGEIKPQTNQPLTPEQSALLVRAIMNDRQTKEFDSTKECNFAIAPPGIGRFRVSAFVQMGLTGAVLRTDQRQDPDHRGARAAADPEGDRAVEARPRASWSAPPARGKSTIARGDGRLPQREDPRPHHHDRGPDRVRAPAPNCVVTQREVGVDTESWHMALKNTLRQAPDVILIGEIRDRETMEYGIQFAETGHLVLATLHANSCQPGARPHHQLLPGGPARAAADGPVAQHPRDDLPAPDPARRAARAASRRWRSC